jgi:hypothetical protein
MKAIVEVRNKQVMKDKLALIPIRALFISNKDEFIHWRFVELEPDSSFILLYLSTEV